MHFKCAHLKWAAATTVRVIAVVALMLAVAGCDRVVVKAKPTSVSVTNVGPQPVIFDTPEAKDQRELRAQGARLLLAREFDELDRVANELRASKVEYEHGYWKLEAFYGGICELPDAASETRWTNLIAHLKLWVKTKPESITARTALGRALRDYAWNARGSGWANSVTQSGWKLFYARLAEAREVLLSATNTSEKCPFWFNSMLGVGLGEGWPREVYDKIFAAGTNYMRTYAPIYFVKCYHLLPRWHGREGEWEQFAQDTADGFGGEEGDILYARMVWDMHANRVYGNIFKESKISWSRTKRGFQLLQERYPDSLAVISEFCYLCGQAGDRATMKALFAKIDGRVDLRIWEEKQRFVTDRQWAFAR